MFGLGVAAYSLISFGKPQLIRSIQMAIIIAIVLSNSYFPWTESPYLPVMIGIAAAWLPIKLMSTSLWATVMLKRKYRLSSTDCAQPLARTGSSLKANDRGAPKAANDE